MTSIGYLKLDYFIKELNIAIEFNGNTFHGNPKFYIDTDCSNPYNKLITAKEMWEKDEIRYKTLLSEKNIKTIVIWEDESKNFNIETLKDYGILF